MYVRKKNWRLQRQNFRKTKNRRLQRQNLRKTKKIGVYNVKIYVRQKKSAFTPSKFT